MRKLTFAIAATAVLASAFNASAAVLSVSASSRVPTALELGNDAGLAGHTIYEFFADTDTDILQVDKVVISEGPLYQNGLGNDFSPPLPAFVAAFPALGADSYITTPGGTAIAGGGFADPGASWFDTDNNGPQVGFKFAQLTIPTTNAMEWFQGRIQTKGVEGPIDFRFSLPIVPEPTTLALASLSMVGLAGLRRRR
jgi:hypothetical protein